MYAVPQSVAESVIAKADAGEIIQGAWRRRGSDGRELVCALAAFGPGINGAADCPAEYMPQWLAELVPVLDDGIVLGDVAWFTRELAARSWRWGSLDAAAWDRVSVAFRKACITQALEHAERVQPTPAPAYWQQVKDACAAVLRALDGDGDLAAATARAERAEAAAWTAARAAWTAARAAWAAAAAARAAEAAAAAARAAEAAAARATAAFGSLCVSLFAALDVEIGSAAATNS